ncbi:MAG: efflux RND transporter periplasmic adaptor subunit [Pseudomonadales bacterium]
MKTAPFLICAFAILTLLSACSDAPDPAERPRGADPFRVVVEPVELSAERTRIEAVGTSRAFQSVTLHPAASGEVVAVRFQPGQFVEKNQVLVELDQRDERLAVELAQVRLKEAERLYERYKNSAATGATLPTTLDAARTELESARIGLGRAKINLDYRTIKAPFAGHVGITDVDAGDRIQPTTPITTLDDRSSLLVSFEVPELMIGKIAAGDFVQISTWNVDAISASGEVIDIDSRIKPETRTFATRARVENAADQLRPGMSFKVRLDLEGNAYPVLSEVSVQWGADGSFIWSVVDGKAIRVPVNIVQRQKGRVLVDSGLQPGDLVVTEGIQRLRPGIAVQPDTAIAADDQSSSRKNDGRAQTTGPG